MDIAIPYKASQYPGVELKYALRSIGKYLTGYDKVILIGDKPEWYTGDHVTYYSQTDGKERDIKNRILKACELPISDNFLIFHDDHFLLKPLDVTEIKPWHGETLTLTLRRARSAYWMAVKETIEYFPETEPLDFDIHTPCIFNKDLFRQINTDDAWFKEKCLKSLYFNSIECEPVFMKDLKINTTDATKPVIYRAIEGRLFFSTGPIAMQEDLLQVFDELYPVKSRWEK